MADAAVRIARLSTRCDLVAGRVRGEALATALSGGLAQRLPAALAAELGTDLNGPDAVVRIGPIELTTALGARADPAELASAVAHKISAAIRQALRGATHGARVWSDRATYLASYILHRLGIQPEPDWAFDEFAKLDHLPAERAAAELIAAQPELLIALARPDTAPGLPTRLVARLEEAHWSALLDPLVSGRTLSEPTPAALAAALRTVAALTPRYDPAREPARATASLLLASLPGNTSDQALPAMLVASAWQVARLKGEVEASGENPGPDERTDRAGTNTARSGHSASSPSLPLFAKRALEHVARARLDTKPLSPAKPAQRSPNARTPTPDGAAPPSRQSQAEVGVEPEPRILQTPFAGLALLSASVNALSLAHHLSPEQLALAVWGTLPEERRDTVRTDRAIALLFPFDPRTLDTATLPAEMVESLLDRLHPDTLPLVEHARGAERWSALILAEFAGRLAGLKASSAPYLQAQFLLREGEIAREADLITVRLASVPLGIVLTMAGLTGTPLFAPHLGRCSIRIDIEKGRRDG